MSRLVSSVLVSLSMGPRKVYRERFKLPLIRFLHSTVEAYKIRTSKGINSAKDVLFRGIVVAFVTSLLVWLSIFMYLAFYYAYVPRISHERPVYIQFESCGNVKGICSFPSAHVQLTKRQQLLMLGQPYKVFLELEMPESPANKELGMFMVCADFHGKEGKLVASSCRSTMLHYRSTTLELIYTLTFSPILMIGVAKEKQTIDVELFSNYEEQESQPVTDVYIEIQSRHIELYSSKFLINAHFSGLRYVMFHWPTLSAAIGITSNLFFIALVCMICWYQLVQSEDYQTLLQKQRQPTKHLVYTNDDIEIENDSSGSSFEEAPLDTTNTVRMRKVVLERQFVEDVNK